MSSDGWLTAKQVEHIKTLFVTYDKDKDGKITNSEVVSTLRELHKDRSEEEIGYMMRILDLDCDKEVDFSEFLKMASLFASNNRMSEIQIRQLFRAFDKDKNGVLSAAEIKQLWSLAPSDENVKKLTDKEMNEMVQVMDINGDGQIDYEEFVTLMTSTVTSNS